MSDHYLSSGAESNHVRFVNEKETRNFGLKNPSR